MTRGYFAGRAQVRNADGQDFAQMRAGVKLHKAIMAAIAHPSMAHRFDGTGLVILEVRMARDFKLAHVRWTVHDDGDSRAAAHALRRNAAALKTMAGKMLGSKHTPRLEFIDDGATSRKEAELDEAFELAETRRLETEAHVHRLARRDAETRRMKAAGSYRPGAYEHLLDDEHTHDDDDDDDDDDVRIERVARAGREGRGVRGPARGADGGRGRRRGRGERRLAGGGRRGRRRANRRGHVGEARGVNPGADERDD